MHDGTRIQTYADEILQDLEDPAGAMVIEDYRVYIGGIPEEPKKHWKDFIDDARIYSYALSPEEDKMLYEGKEPPKEKIRVKRINKLKVNYKSYETY